jgi:RNase P subunit RPR2
MCSSPRTQLLTMSHGQLPVAICPGCKIPMHVKSRQPLKPNARLDEIVYECPQCGTETRRVVKHERRLGRAALRMRG